MSSYWEKIKAATARQVEKKRQSEQKKRKAKARLYDQKRNPPKNYPPQPCALCGTVFKPRTYKTRFCGDPCRFRYLSLKSKGFTDDMIFSNSFFKTHPDKMALKLDKTIMDAIKSSPDLSTKVAVVIDHRTTIYIDPWKDPVQARNNYLSKFNSL